MDRMTVDEYKALIEKTGPKITKYKNTKARVDGMEFDSIAESRRYLVLKEMQRQGEIKSFRRQPSFTLTMSGNLRYRPDFYVSGINGEDWVEDVKGFETRNFINKKKLWEEVYPNLPLRIVR